MNSHVVRQARGFCFLLGIGFASVVSALDTASELAALKAKYPDVGRDCSAFEKIARAGVYQEAYCYQGLVWPCLYVEEDDNWKDRELLIREILKMRILPDFWHVKLAGVLARQDRKVEALDELEKGVAAGFCAPELVEKEKNLDGLRGEKRFAELLKLIARNAQMLPKEQSATIRNGTFEPAEQTTECVVDYGAVHLSTRVDVPLASRPLIYVDRNCAHGASARAKFPQLDFTEMRYPQEMVKLDLDRGAANQRFCSTDGQFSVPSFVVSDVTGTMYRGSSLLAEHGIDYRRLWVLTDCLALGNVLQIYAAGRDYGVDGVDRYPVNLPFAVNYVGDASDQQFFVRTLAEGVRALPDAIYREAATNQTFVSVMQYLLRRAQKQVRDEADWLTGAAHPPAFYTDSIDAARLVRLAREMKTLPPPMPYLGVEVDKFEQIPVNEDACAPGIRSWANLDVSRFGSALAFRWQQKTFKLKLKKLELAKNGRLVWKILQGDPQKVRIEETADGSEINVAIDYHPVFTVVDAHGKTNQTMRVDIGFFQKIGDRHSLPFMLNMVFSPNDSRTYDENGRVRTVDYSRPQIAPAKFQSPIFTRGFWRDTYRYSPKGEFAGWVRDDPRCPGSERVWTTDFLEVVERDDLGRPTRLARPRLYEWLQDAPSDKAACDAYTAECNARLDAMDGDVAAATYLCAYASTNDVVGKIEACPYQRFAPERFNPYADFGSASDGFSYPLSMEIEHAYNIYQLSNYGAYMTNQEQANARLPLDRQIPMARRPKKMVLNGDKTADAWPYIEDVAASFAENLIQTPDGACRYLRTGKDGRQRLESIVETRRMWNECMSRVAAKRMDRAGFRRCSTNELLLVRDHGWSPAISSNMVLYTQGDDAKFVKARKDALTGWHIGGDLCLMINSNGQSGSDELPGSETRYYVFVYICTNETPQVSSAVDLEYFPTADVVNAVRFTYEQDSPQAENDLAALIYSGAVNPRHYDEEDVLYFLRRAAKKNYTTAFYNLSVFYENRLDPVSAKAYMRKVKESLIPSKAEFERMQRRFEREQGESQSKPGKDR